MKPSNPYVGPRAFEEGDSARFFGRDAETRQLASLVIAHRAVLLYAPSGAGKSSLLNAGLWPYLKQRKKLTILPLCRVGGDLPPGVAGTEVKNIYVFNLLVTLAGAGTQPADLAGLTLSAGLATLTPHPRPLSEGEGGTPSPSGKAGEGCSPAPSGRAGEGLPRRPQPCLLIIDQFEELFTTHPERYAERADFVWQLQQTLREYPHLSLLLAMREDYIAPLDAHAAQLPDRLRTRFRLELLDAAAAQLAVQNPARQAGVEFADDAAARLLDDLRMITVQAPDGATTAQLGPTIEPVQLQVVCRRLWDGLAADDYCINVTDLNAVGDVDTALAGYYAASVTAAAQTAGVRERAIREWFDQQLITPQGIRGQVLRGAEQSQGLANRALTLLVDAHLVRAEQRLNAIWYELAHDRLIAPVRSDNAAWFAAHLSPLQRQADLWEKQRRSGGLLLREDALVEAERWASDHADDLLPAERDFLAACQEARAQAQRERRKNRFIQGLAIVALIISIVALYFFFQANVRRQEAERLSRLSLAQMVISQAKNQQERHNDECAALLARQAYLFTYQYPGGVPSQIDAGLRAVLTPQNANQILKGHEGIVSQVVFNPDGKMLASASQDGTVRLWDPTNGDTRSVLRGHEGWVKSIAFTSDGRTLASGSEDTTVRLWDPVNGTERAVLRGREDTVWTLAFSPDGQLLASGSENQIVRLWDVASGKERAVLRGHGGPVWSLAFSPDGQMLASGSKSGMVGLGMVGLWNVASGKLQAALPGHSEGIESLRFSPDGTTLASTDGHTMMWLWDAATKKERQVLPGLVGDSHAVAFSLDGQSVAAVGVDNIVRVWNVANGTKRVELRGHKGRVHTLVFSPNGATMASASKDKTIRLWDVVSGKEQAVLQADVKSLVFSQDGAILASGGMDNTIHLWDVTSGQERAILRGHEGDVKLLVFNPDGLTLASASEDKTIRLWEVSNGQERLVLKGHAEEVKSLAFSPDGRTIASGSGDSTVRLWDVTSGKEHAVLRGDEDAVWSLAFSPDNKTLASASENRIIRLWDVASGEERAVLRGHSGPVWSLAFSPDGQMLASGSKDDTVRLWGVTRGIERKVLYGHKGWVKSLTFSPDGKLLASGGEDKIVRLWDVTSGENRAVLQGHEGRVKSLTFSPDGKLLASGGEDKIVRLWDVTSGKERVVLRGHTGIVNTLTFSPDGATLASASDDQTVRLWNVENGTIQVVLRDHQSAVYSLAFSPDQMTMASASMDKTVRLWLWNMKKLPEAVCQKVERNLTWEEWQQFVSPEIPYERTCPNLSVHSSVLEAAQNLAKTGKIDEAKSIFQQVLKIDPDSRSRLNPTKEANSWRVQGLLEESAYSLLINRKEGMTAAVNEAMKLDPTLDKMAILLNTECRLYSLYDHTNVVRLLNSCEIAVRRATGEQDKACFRESRGLARALTGNTADAIEDFQVYVDWIGTKESMQKIKAEHQRWIDALKKGENPFTPEVLEQLRNK